MHLALLLQHFRVVITGHDEKLRHIIDSDAINQLHLRLLLQIVNLVLVRRHQQLLREGRRIRYPIRVHVLEQKPDNVPRVGQVHFFAAIFLGGVGEHGLKVAGPLADDEFVGAIFLSIARLDGDVGISSRLQEVPEVQAERHAGKVQPVGAALDLDENLEVPQDADAVVEQEFLILLE